MLLFLLSCYHTGGGGEEHDEGVQGDGHDNGVMLQEDKATILAMVDQRSKT